MTNASTYRVASVLVLASLFDAAGTTSLIMNERRAMSTSRTGEVPDYAHLARCVIQLAIANDGGKLRRSVAISKHAGSDHCKEIWHYQIDERGFHLDGANAPSRG